MLLDQSMDSSSKRRNQNAKPLSFSYEVSDERSKSIEALISADL